MRAKEYVSHYYGEKPAETLGASLPTRAQETNQIHTANIVRNAPPTIEYMPLGYNRENILDRIARADFWNFNIALNPAHVEEYSPTGHINFEEYARSVTLSYGINSNHFIWDQIPELENFPVSGRPEEVSQQYVLYNVEPAFLAATKKNLHISQQAVPTAYGTPNQTSKQQYVVYQTPVTQLASAVAGTSWLQKIKTWLVGG